MKKRVLSLILVFSIMNSFFAVPAKAFYLAEGATVGPLSFTCWFDDGHADLSSCDQNATGDIAVPSSVNGYTVKYIRNWAFDWCTKIESITLPETIIEIGLEAFSGCESLKSITIPALVEDIGKKAFIACSSLSDIKVSEKNRYYSSQDGVLYNKDMTTLVCYPEGKTDASYVMPESVTAVESGRINEQNHLEYIALSHGITALDDYFFSNCDNLKSVFIPISVTKMGGSIFAWSENISDVYYCGSEEDWNKIEIDDNNWDLNQATIHFNYPCGKSHGVIEERTFQFASGFGNKKGDDGNSIATYKYDDSYFSEPSMDNYNHDLAKMSLRLAMSAFAFHGNGDEKYKNQDRNVRELLTDIGFGGENAGNFDSIGYREKPSVNSIGAFAGHKKVTFNDKEYTIIALAVRGGNYESEWGGNFNVGTGEEHKGFQLAREQVVEFLSQYITNKKIRGHIKLWITGYSRAAATTNLTAAYLTDHPEELNKWKTDTDAVVNLAPEDIYAYCFETPAGTRAADRNDAKYNNIYSIVNQNDFVPMVAPERWGYGRYGITYFLPSPRSNYDYNKLVSNMYTYYDKYTKKNYNTTDHAMIEDFDEYKLQWSWQDIRENYGFSLLEKNSKRTMDDYLLTVVNRLATVFKNPQYYTETLEDTLVFLGDQILGQERTDVFLNTFKKELSKRLDAYTDSVENIVSIDYEDIKELLYGTVKSTFERLKVEISEETIDNVVVLLALLISDGSLETLLGNVDILPLVHFPELCLAWMDSVEPSKFRTTRKVIVNCPVDVKVYDSNNKLVAAIYGDAPQEISGSSIVAYVDGNGQKVVYLPNDEEFSIRVIATDNGEVSYSVHEEDLVTGSTKVINFDTMEVSAKDILYGTVNSLEDTSEDKYTFVSDVESADKEIIEDAQPVSVTADSQGNGGVSGGGYFHKGEYAELKAIPLNLEYFIGWYDGDELVSEDSTYRFRVTEETNLTARFSEDTAEIKYLADNDEVVLVDRIYKNDFICLPEMNKNPNYIILGVYTDKDCTTPVNKELICTEDTVLYVKAVAKDNWVQFNKDSNSIVVYSPDDKYEVKLMTALYADNKLKDVDTSVVDLVMGKNEFDNPVADVGTADMLKVFVWSGVTEMNPLFKHCEAGLEE